MPLRPQLGTSIMSPSLHSIGQNTSCSRTKSEGLENMALLLGGIKSLQQGL